nr:hypothetical protein [Tanacetum cinerariifolium]
MRPFGCHVTILNTLDHLGKFEEKADEGFFVEYSLNSKAFRVYNTRTRNVEENLHVRFLENKPITGGTNSNDFVDGLLFYSSSKNASNDEPQPSSDAGTKEDEGVSKKSRIGDQERPSINTASLNVNTDRPSINTASPNVNTDGPSIKTASTNDNVEVDLRNISTTYLSGVWLRRMIKPTNEQGFIGDVYEGKTYEDLNTCLFGYFLSQIEPTRVVKDLSDLAWNKKDERGIVIKNKVRVARQGYTQEEGIDYDEVFAPVARIKAIRLFLAYALFMGFMVYQMDVNSAFLYGRIKEEEYVCQPPGFKDPNHPNEELYVKFKRLMKDKFQMGSMGEPTFFLWLQSLRTPVDKKKTLAKDADGDNVDVHLYRSMIGSLMYLTTSRPDIMYAIANVRIVDNREQEITAIVDGKEFIVTEASVRRHLQLVDADGISVLPNTKIIDQLSLMGYVFTNDKLTFQKGIQAEEGEGLGHPSEPQPPPSTAQPTNEELISNVASSSHQKTQILRQALNKDNRVERDDTIAASLDAEQASSNINRTQSTTMPNVPFPQGIGASGSLRCQEAMGVPLLRLGLRWLKLRVKKLEKKKKKGKSMIEEIDQDAGVTLVQIDAEDQGRFDDETNFDVGFYKVQSYTRRRRAVSTSSGGISTASRLFSTTKESVSTTGASMPVSTTGMVQRVNISIPSPVVVKDKDELDEEESQRMARLHEATQSFTKEEWENIRARVEADEELAQRLQAEEMNKYTEAKRNKPMKQAQQRTYMSTYVKNMGSYTLNQLKKLSFNKINKLFETTMKIVNTFVPMETEDRGRASKLAVESSQATIIDFAEVGSSKRAAEAKLNYEGSKRQKTNEALGSVREQPDEEENELSQENLHQMIMVVLVEEVYVEAL